MIYLLEDDESIRKLVLYALETQGFQSKGFESSEKFWKALEQETPDLLLLDPFLPDRFRILAPLPQAFSR